MPKYNWDIKDLLWDEDVKKIFDVARSDHERAFISALWMTGARPAELCKRSVKEDFQFNDALTSFRIKTLKLGNSKRFMPEDRTLNFKRQSGINANIYLEFLVKYVRGLEPNGFLFPYTTRWGEATITRRSLEAIGKPLAPYHFRHSCLTHLARNGYGLSELMHFKGAAGIRSVDRYVRAMPFVVHMESLRRSKAQYDSGERVVKQDEVLPDKEPTSG